MTALGLANLPAVDTLRITAIARGAVHLPPLPTTALRGALVPALRARELDLLEPPGRPLRGAGITDRAPAAIALAPETCALGRRRVELAPGDRFGVRIALIGRRAIDASAAVIDAAGAALAAGIGVAPGGRERVPLELESAERVAPAIEPAPASACELVLFTPLRLVFGGRVVSRIDAESLWAALARRADLLARVHGAGPVLAPDHVPPALSVTRSTLRVVRVRRHSSRQSRRMTWPGLAGTVALAGEGLPDAWPLLRFAEAAGLGKATTFGFGRLRLRA